MTDGRPLDPLELARQEEHRRTLEREAARDAVVRAWASTTKGAGGRELSLVARERIRSLSLADDRVLARLGTWLGCPGDRAARVEAAENELAHASERRLIQLWFLLELAQSAAYAVLPSWALPWLEGLGFVDPGAPASPVGRGGDPKSVLNPSAERLR
jgi:hypothetical protein